VLTNVTLHPVRTQLEPEADVLTRGLRTAGYRMGYVGKWHVHKDKDPLAFGFEAFVSLEDYAAHRRDLGVPFPPESNNYCAPAAGVDPIAVEHSRPAFLTDQAIGMLERFTREGSRPFFVRLDFHGPHMPMVVPEPYASMYAPSEISPYPNFDDTLADKPAVQRTKRRHWGTENMTWEDWQPIVARYYGEVTLIDAQIGRILQSLKALKVENDTVVIFQTDHGDTMSAHRIWNKDYTMYDEIYRVPLVIRWPGVTSPGSRCDTYVHHCLDLTPTLLEIAGATVPDGLDGQTLLPLLHGQMQDRPREAFCEFHGSHMGLYSMRMLQTDRYKYVYHTNDIDELYAHASDPFELKNVAQDHRYAADLSALKRRMVDWMAKTKDHLYNEWTVLWLTEDLDRAAKAPGRMNTPW
jgi:arylsulfatase A-like enzyme